MPITLAKLKALLDVDEPDYPALAEIADGAMQHVRKLAASPDESLASKAASPMMPASDTALDASDSSGDAASLRTCCIAPAAISASAG